MKKEIIIPEKNCSIIYLGIQQGWAFDQGNMLMKRLAKSQRLADKGDKDGTTERTLVANATEKGTAIKGQVQQHPPFGRCDICSLVVAGEARNEVLTKQDLEISETSSIHDLIYRPRKVFKV